MSDRGEYPTKSFIDEYFEYDPNIGALRWKKKSSHLSRVQIGSVAGSVQDDGYRSIKFKGRKYMAHVLIWIAHGNYLSSGQVIDHINGTENGDFISNLRSITARQNGFNRKVSRNNKSGISGVRWMSNISKWRATIKRDKKLFLGEFDTLLDAACARRRAEIAIHEGVHRIYREAL